MEAGKKLGENRQRIGNRSPVDAGMEIALGAGKFNLVVVQTAKPVGNRRHAFPKHGSVGDHQRVGLQFFLVLLHVIPKAYAAHFLFAFNQHLDVDGQLAVDLLERFKCLDMNVDLAFVVGGAATKKIAVAHGGFEGRRSPELERFGRLHIIMSVEKDRRLPRRLQRFGIDERMQVRRNDLNRLESGCAQVVGNPASTSLDIRLVFALGADARDTQKLR